MSVSIQFNSRLQAPLGLTLVENARWIPDQFRNLQVQSLPVTKVGLLEFRMSANLRLHLAIAAP
jgi:hypothetical protein